MSKILKRVVQLYGPTAKKVAAEVLGDGSGTSSGAAPSESQGAAPVERTKEVATSSALPQSKHLFLKRNLLQGLVLPGSKSCMAEEVKGKRHRHLLLQVVVGGEEKSTESTALVARKRTRAQTAEAAAGGDDDKIIDFTVGRELEPLTDDAISKPVDIAEAREDVETEAVREVEAAEAKEDEPPKKKKQKKLRKNGAPVATGIEVAPSEKESTAATGIDLIVAPQSQAEADEQDKKAKAKGKANQEPVRTNLLPPSLQLPPSVLPPSLQPTDPETAQQLPSQDVEVTTTLSEEELSQHMSSAVVKACTLWTEVVKRREEREKNLQGFISSSNSLKESMEKTLEHALQRALDADEREKKAQTDAEHSKRQRTAMEKNYTKAHNDFIHERSKTEAATLALKERDAKISSLVDDNKQWKKKYEALEKKHKALEEENKKQKEMIKMREDEAKILKETDAKHQKTSHGCHAAGDQAQSTDQIQSCPTLGVKEALSIDKYVKTDNYDNAIGDICHDFYNYGFQQVRLQAERAIGKAGKVKILDVLDPTKTIGLEVPEDKSFPKEYLPKRTSTKRPPIELLLEWEALA
ncbi:hypothetical protein Dimus_026991, partial [Dionaea muscipula]